MHVELDLLRSIPHQEGQEQWIQGAFENPFFEIVYDYTKKKVHNLLNKNLSFENTYKRMRQYGKFVRPHKPYLFFPRSVGKPVLLDRQELKAILDLQLAIGSISLFGVPDPTPSLSLTHLGNLFKWAEKYIENRAQKTPTVVPFFRLDENALQLQKKLDWTLKEEYQMVGLVYFANTYATRHAVAEIMRDKDVLIHITNVPRRADHNLPVAQPHLLPMDIGDSICIRKGYGGSSSKEPTAQGPKFSETTPPRRMPKGPPRKRRPELIRFDSKALGYLTYQQHQEMFGETLNCSCPLCRGHNLSDLHAYWQELRDPSVRAAFLHIHEVFASFSEFKISQTNLRSTSYRDYLLAKPLVSRYKTILPEFQMSTQAQLTDFFGS